MSDRPPRLRAPRVVRNCPARWDHMRGDDRVRHCTHCDRNVYNLSGMAAYEAAAFLAEQTGDRCVRFYRRADGTVLTANCGRVEQTRFRVRAAVVSTLTLFGLAVKAKGAWEETSQGEVVTGKLLPQVGTGPLHNVPWREDDPRPEAH